MEAGNKEVWESVLCYSDYCLGNNMYVELHFLQLACKASGLQVCVGVGGGNRANEKPQTMNSQRDVAQQINKIKDISQSCL